MIEAFIRVKNSKFRSFWTNFKEHITNLLNIESQSSYAESIRIILYLCNNLETLSIESALKALDYYAVQNESSILEHMANFMKVIFYNFFQTNPSIAITQNDLDILSQKLKIFIVVYSNDNILISQTSEPLPAVYLIKYEIDNKIYYGNLIPNEFLDIKNETVIDENCIPIVGINKRNEENYDDKVVVSEDLEGKSLFVDEGENVEVEDDQMNLKNEYEKKLIEYMLEVLGNKILPKECAKKIVKAAEEDGYKDENIDKIKAQIKKKSVGTRYLNYSASKTKCNKCANMLKETFPISLTCKTTSLCVDCIVDNYKNTNITKCADCHRNYTDIELSLINSFCFK
ncbi:hypothetical protein SteCoe_14671 [Stentor coeruleus]|uniref:Uncharacterized protein n=1 Tax=Stentor coeruleus TaxID=5963 RepID=A0A1R2C5I6_9CILI|nr:hypothetical protein SteCoe_14671 [Stentor coeruleus]